ncbi:MAG: substrate-binding domain-containing protein [Anaerolineae bacterium]|nr:substrate-binding domain-containing protein [Anaerolineae bacterium]
MSRGKRKTSGGRNTRPTIGYLSAGLSGIGQPVWTGMVDAAQERDANLICFTGSSLLGLADSDRQSNIAYALVSAESVDGVVSWASILGHYVGASELAAFHEQYRPLPLVTIGRTLEGLPSLLMDSYEGMREAVTHLIEVHGYRRLAFIRGPESHVYAQGRYRAYVETLEAHGLPVDPNLITPPAPWGPATGREAVRLLLDERGLRPKIDLEGIVSVSEDTLVGALEVLQARGVRVPDDVAVVGFDDTVLSQTHVPPITTVAAPFYETGRAAAEKLLDLMEGVQVAEETIVPSALVVRQSCGCLDLVVAQAMVGPVEARGGTFESILVSQRDQVLAAMEQAVGPASQNVDADWRERLLDSFAGDLRAGSPGAFLSALGGVLRQVVAIGGELTEWQGVVSALRRQALPYLDGQALRRAEDLWQQARTMIGEAAQRAQARQRRQAEQRAQIMHQIGTELIATLDLDELVDVLTRSLPSLSIPSCYLSLYEDPQPYRYPQPAPEWSWLVLAYGKDGRVELEPGGRRFPSRRLVPEGLLPQERQYSLVVRPLFSQQDQIGFALFEVGPQEGATYETLSGQISSALQGALLVQRLEERSAELARQQYILDTFIGTVPDRIYFKDLEGRITRANKAHAAKMGFDDPVEEIGKSDFDFFPEEQARIKYEQEQEIIRTGEPILNLEEANGVGQWSLTTKMPLRDEKGEIIGTFGISRDITEMKEAQAALEKAYAEVGRQVAERTAELKHEVEERERAQAESLHLQQEVIEAQQQAIRELSTPIIPVLEGVIVMPLIGSIDTTRARDITRSLLAGIRTHSAKVVILDITGVPIVDSGVAAYLNKTIQAARLKGARAIVTGISEAVATTIVDLGIDWSGVETLSDLKTGLRAAIAGIRQRAGE